MSNRNRRQFLEDSMLAAAAAVAAGSTPQLFAQEASVSSPNEKLGVAVVGVRGRGNTHIGAFAGRRDTEVLYICDVDEGVGQGRIKKVSDKQGGRRPQFVTDIRKCLDDPRVDIVSIATPNHWHALGAIWSMQAGKDVYLEKPVSHNVSEGRRIVEACERYGRICQTGTQSRSNPGMIDAIEFVRGGKIGTVNVARGLCFKPRGSIGPRGEYDVPAGVDYDLWSGPAPLLPVTRKQFHYDWHWQWAYGNGDLGNQGIHQMDLARWGLGVDRVSDSVLSYGGRFGYADAGETANTQVVMHSYGDRSLVFEVRGLRTEAYRGAKIGVIFEGSDGYVVMTTYHSGAAFDKQGNKIRDFSGGNNDLHFSNFLKAVRSRRRADLNADILEGHLSSALCHLGNISYQLGQPMHNEEAAAALRSVPAADHALRTLDRTVDHLQANQVNVVGEETLLLGRLLKVDPQTETFLGDAQADQMLSREYRQPFVVPAAGQV